MSLNKTKSRVILNCHNDYEWHKYVNGGLLRKKAWSVVAGEEVRPPGVGDKVRQPISMRGSKIRQPQPNKGSPQKIEQGTLVDEAHLFKALFTTNMEPGRMLVNMS